VLFDRRHFAALADVSGDRGGRRILLSGEGSALVETGDPGVRRDIDTPEDLDALDRDGIEDEP
jgi:molybdenum cofactor cytidylyltransferase